MSKGRGGRVGGVDRGQGEVVAYNNLLSTDIFFLSDNYGFGEASVLL